MRGSRCIDNVASASCRLPNAPPAEGGEWEEECGGPQREGPPLVPRPDGRRCADRHRAGGKLQVPITPVASDHWTLPGASTTIFLRRQTLIGGILIAIFIITDLRLFCY